MIYTVDDANYGTPGDLGEMTGPIFMINGYGAAVTKYYSGTYDLALLKQKSYDVWSCEMDEKLSQVSQTPYINGLTKEDANAYLAQVSAL